PTSQRGEADARRVRAKSMNHAEKYLAQANRHIAERASMSAYFTNALTPPTGLGLLASSLAAGNSRSGSAWLGRSQKDGLPTYRAECFITGSRPSTRAQRRGSLVAAPFQSEFLNAQMCKGRFEAGGELSDIFRLKNTIAPKRRMDHFGHRLLTTRGWRIPAENDRGQL